MQLVIIEIFLFFFQIDRFVSVSKLKYYFAVDTSYVVKKLGLLVFPFTHKVCNRFLQLCNLLLNKRTKF